jgi:hypothetical protein
LFLALAGLLAWGGTVDPEKASVRWIAVAGLAFWGLISLFFPHRSWLPDRATVEHTYLQMISLGVAITLTGWLIPSSGTTALLATGGLLVVVPLGAWIWLWYQRRETKRDDAHRPR